MIPQVNIPFSVNQLIILSNLPANCILTAVLAQLSTDTSRKQKWINEPILGKFLDEKQKHSTASAVVLTQNRAEACERQFQNKISDWVYYYNYYCYCYYCNQTAVGAVAVEMSLSISHLWLCCMYCVTGTLTSNMTSWNQQRSTEKNKQFALLTVASLLSKVTNNFHFLKILTFKFMDQVITLLKGDSYKLNTL